MSEQTYKLTNKNKGDLAMFIGTEQWHPHWLRRFTYTDGVKFLAENTDCFWLLDIIASYQPEKKFRDEEFQVWRLVRFADDPHKATVFADDGNDNTLGTQILEYTDFPLSEIKLYLAGVGTQKVLMLPSEY